MTCCSTIPRLVFVLVIGIAVVTATAQVTTPRTIKFVLPAEPKPAELLKHDLAWINTSNYFDQSNLDSAAIDKEIEKRIKAYDHETAIVTFDVPINSKRLKPPTLQKYSEFNKQITELNFAKPGNALDRKAYFWRYGDIDIAVHEDKYKDQLNVYSIARAIEILKYRYPKAYNRLFVETRNFPSDPVQFGNCKNKFSTLLFSFNETPDAIAVGGTAWVGNTRKVCVGEYSNISVVSIHSIKMQGANKVGSLPIYRSSAEENYIRYLREGLVESLVHEMLHRYVDYRRSYDKAFNTLYNIRSGTPFVDTFGKGEETILASTSMHYFAREGGLQSKLPSYYRAVLESNVVTLMNLGLANNYVQIADPSGRNAQEMFYVDRLILNIL